MNSRDDGLAPTSNQDRIGSLDLLRGIALLGILIMNIQGFSMIGAAYFNPTAYGDLSGANRWVWTLSHLFADQKFMTLFSILFGAGVLLMTSRAEEKGMSPARLHYRRTAVLLGFGLVHAYLLWFGDVLVWYALCSLLVFLFRKKSPRTLIILGVISLAVPPLLYFFFQWSLPHMPAEARAGLISGWTPPPEEVQRELDAYRSGWLAQMPERAPMALVLHTFVFMIWAGWRAGGLMLIGMGLFKLGILSAQRTIAFYVKLAAVGLPVGLALVWYGMTRHFAEEWAMEYSQFIGVQFNYWGSVLVSLGYLSLVMILCKCAAPGTLTRALSAVGRTALTNYLLQTVICTFIFYGHGLGLFGSVERTGQILIVLGIWVVQLVASPLWLSRFRFGPCEWLWRSLTYGRLQPLRA